MEQELRAMLGLAPPGEPEPVVSVQESGQAPSEEPQNPMQDVESSSTVPNPAPKITNPPARSSNDGQVDQPKIAPIVALLQDQTLTKGVLPTNLTPATTKSSQGLPPASEPPQVPSWNPIGFLGDEDEDEEEIPSINMDSDSD